MKVRYTGAEPVILTEAPTPERPWPGAAVLVRPGEVFDWPDCPPGPFEVVPTAAKKERDA
jgi:hypothetical protein